MDNLFGTIKSDKNDDNASRKATKRNDFFIDPRIDVSSLSSGKIARENNSKREYLEINKKGKGIWDYGFTTIGMCYLLAGIAGGIRGIHNGLKKSPSDKWQIKLNSVLNHSGKWGSRYGNIAGCISITYVLSDFIIEKLELNQAFGSYRGYVASGAAGLLTGGGYMSVGSSFRSRIISGAAGSIVGMLLHVAFSVWTHQAA